MHKHWELHHEGRKTEFSFNILGFFRTPLERQVAEGVRIARTGATRLLNSKAVYSRCPLPRLSIDKEEVEENLGDVQKTMEDDDDDEVFEDESVERMIMTGSRLEKTMARQKKRNKTRDLLCWGEWEAEDQVGDQEERETWDDLLGFLVEY